MDSKVERIPLGEISSEKKRQPHKQRTTVRTTVNATPLAGDAELPLRVAQLRLTGTDDQQKVSSARQKEAAAAASAPPVASSCGGNAFLKCVGETPSRIEVNNNDYTSDSRFIVGASGSSSFVASGGYTRRLEVPFGQSSAKDASQCLQQQAGGSTTKPGNHQSPVDITDVAVVQDTSLNELCYGYRRDKGAVFFNDGVLPRCDLSPATHVIRGGPLLCDYELAQFHFHFAGPGTSGSEHALNGKRYPAEVHFVHYKAQYKSFEAALKHKDGLAVIGALLDVSDLPDVTTTAFDMDIQKFNYTNSVGSSHRTTVDLSTYGLSSIEDYYTYNGSLTSPPCQECVCWLLLCRPITISTESYRSLTQLSSVGGGFISRKGNFRVLQPLNDRVIRRSFCAMSRVLRIFRRPGTSSVGQQKP